MSWFAEIQALVDEVDPIRQPDGRWKFVSAEGRVLVVWLREGALEVLTYFRKGSQG